MGEAVAGLLNKWAIRQMGNLVFAKQVDYLNRILGKEGILS